MFIQEFEKSAFKVPGMRPPAAFKGQAAHGASLEKTMGQMAPKAPPPIKNVAPIKPPVMNI